MIYTLISPLILGKNRCKTCKDEIYHARKEAHCPTCRTVQREEHYTPKLFESGEVHREMFIRTEDLKDLRLVKQEDMPGETPDQQLENYNDFLEQIEDVTYELTNDLHPNITEKKLQELRQKYSAVLNASAKRTASEIEAKKLAQRMVGYI